MIAFSYAILQEFLSTPSARRATSSGCATRTPFWYFYPRPPRGGRRADAGHRLSEGRFLSTPSARRATWVLPSVLMVGLLFLSTPSARRATHRGSRPHPGRWHFYPRPPRGGRPGICTVLSLILVYFYPRPPRGGRLWLCMAFSISLMISIHALREEGDLDGEGNPTDSGKFLSTPSARRATGPRCSPRRRPKISIHALREEGDRRVSRRSPRRLFDFYPRPPRGGRRGSSAPVVKYPVISIHALREEGDLPSARTAQLLANFYPRPPRGGRRGRAKKLSPGDIFLSTPSARRATRLGVSYGKYRA